MKSAQFGSLDLFSLEKKLWKLGYKKVAGVDEAGRGPLAGPVVVAACVLPVGYGVEDDLEGRGEEGREEERRSKVSFPLIYDSKQLTVQQRDQAYEALTQNEEVRFSIAVVSEQEIDAGNILQATLLGMQRALTSLIEQPDYILVDGPIVPRMPSKGGLVTPIEGIVGGDASSISIAAASILAKVTRDRMMDEIDKEYPQYQFHKNKGYGTPEHLALLKEHGPCRYHRKSFAPVRMLIRSPIHSPVQPSCLSSSSNQSE